MMTPRSKRRMAFIFYLTAYEGTNQFWL